MQYELPADTPWWAVILFAAFTAFAFPTIKTWRNQARTDKVLKKVDHQVSNEHETNLRDDVDDATAAATRAAEASERAAVAAEKAANVAQAALEAAHRLERENVETRRDIGGIREEQRDQRKEVRAVAARLDDSVKERRQQTRDLREGFDELRERLDNHLEEKRP